jgi:hypothetical protein
MKFRVYIDYEYTHKLCTKYSLKVRNYKIFRRDETLKLYTPDNPTFNKSEIKLGIYFFKKIK